MENSYIDENLRLKNEIKNAAIEVGSTSTCHGIPNIIRTKWTIIKLIWLISMICSFSYCSNLICESVLEYLNYETVTDTKIIYQTTSLFPTVSFCNLQGLTKPFILDNNLLLCYYNREKCKIASFYKYFDINYGNCYKFNAGLNSDGNKTELLSSKKAGKRNGLRIDLFIGTNEFSDDTTGIHVIVHNNTIHPTYNEGVDIAPGFRTSLGLSRIFDSKLSWPYNECVEDFTKLNLNSYPLVAELLKSNRTYRRTDCFDLCFNEQIVKNCDCNSSLIYVNENCRLNNNTEMKNCIVDQEIKFYDKNKDKEAFGQCFFKCPLECDSIRFLITTSLADYPGKLNSILNSSIIKLNFPNGIHDYNSVKSSVLSFRIYYDDLLYTQISQQPKVLLINLISNIGGILGLFLGVSFLSTIELIELSLEILFLFYNHYKYKKNNQH